MPQNSELAVKWYTLAAEQGFALAQYNLGLMYKLGQGVIKDDKAAAQWYRKAAEQGLGSAQTNLGVMYAFGAGVEKNFLYAYMWGGLGASNGSVNGQKLRDDFALKMSASQLSEAKKLARECKISDYKSCY